MMKYFAVTNANGLISQELQATTAADAIAEVKEAIADHASVDWINDAQTDLEDACGVSCDDLSYSAALELCQEAGASYVWGELTDDSWNILSFKERITSSARLQELTGCESGLIVYDGGNVICCNWSSIEGLPRSSFVGLTGLGEELTCVGRSHIGSVLATIAVDLDDVRDFSDGSGVAELRENDCDGMQYDLGNAQVICPKGWA